MNKILKKATVVVGALSPLALFASHAFAEITPAPTAPASLIPVASSSLAASLVSYIPTVFGDLLPIIALLVGIPFAFWVITKVIGLIKRNTASGGGKKA